MIQSHVPSGAADTGGGMTSFFLPGRRPRGFLVAWERDGALAGELYWRLSEQLQWEYHGVREAGLSLGEAEKEEAVLLSGRLKNGALFSVDGTDYSFYRRGGYNLFYVSEQSFRPLLPEAGEGPKGTAPDLCRGVGPGEGFFLMASQALAGRGELLPPGFRSLRHALPEVQFQLAEYAALLGGDGLPAAILYWG